MQMDDRRMLRDAGFVGEPDRPLADLERLQHVRVRRRLAGLEVPQTPHRAHHQRFDKQRHDVMVIGKVGMDAPHRGGIGVVPMLEFRWRHAVRFLETAGQRLDQPPFDRRSPDRVLARASWM